MRKDSGRECVLSSFFGIASTLAGNDRNEEGFTSINVPCVYLTGSDER